MGIDLDPRYILVTQDPQATSIPGRLIDRAHLESASQNLLWVILAGHIG